MWQISRFFFIRPTNNFHNIFPWSIDNFREIFFALDWRICHYQMTKFLSFLLVRGTNFVIFFSSLAVKSSDIFSAIEFLVLHLVTDCLDSWFFPHLIEEFCDFNPRQIDEFWVFFMQMIDEICIIFSTTDRRISQYFLHDWIMNFAIFFLDLDDKFCSFFPR